MSFVHIVTFKWNDGFSAEPVVTGLLELAPRLSGVQRYLCGSDIGFLPDTYDTAVVGVFESSEHFLAYRNHPEHQRILNDLIAPNLADKTTVQFEV